MLDNHTCLQRNFNDSMTLPSLAFLRDSPEQYPHFEQQIRSEVHDYVHDIVCGHMCSYYASSDPFFWMHHGFVDKLWDEWQKNSDRHKYAYYLAGNKDSPMTFCKLSPRLFVDSNLLPGGVSVCYVEPTHKYRQRELFRRNELGPRWYPGQFSLARVINTRGNL